MKKIKKLENLKDNVALFDDKRIFGGDNLLVFDKNNAMWPCTITTTLYFLPDGFGDKDKNY